MNSSTDVHFEIINALFKQYATESRVKQRFRKRFCECCDIITKQQFKGVFSYSFFHAQCDITLRGSLARSDGAISSQETVETPRSTSFLLK